MPDEINLVVDAATKLVQLVATEETTAAMRVPIIYKDERYDVRVSRVDVTCEDGNPGDSTLMYSEILHVIERYPDMTAFATIGALEAVKADMLERIRNCDSDEND